MTEVLAPNLEFLRRKLELIGDRDQRVAETVRVLKDLANGRGVEERVTNGDSEDDAFELVAGSAGVLAFWLEGNDGTFKHIRQWMDEFCQEYDCPGITAGRNLLDCEAPQDKILN